MQNRPIKTESIVKHGISWSYLTEMFFSGEKGTFLSEKNIPEGMANTWYHLYVTLKRSQPSQYKNLLQSLHRQIHPGRQHQGEEPKCIYLMNIWFISRIWPEIFWMHSLFSAYKSMSLIWSVAHKRKSLGFGHLNHLKPRQHLLLRLWSYIMSPVFNDAAAKIGYNDFQTHSHVV